jgi:adenylate cyclase class 2
LIEVEIKARIQNPDEIRQRSIKENGSYQFSLLHEDTYYNMPIELRDFKETDEALRIRKSVKFYRDEPKNKQQHYYITYKGAKLDDSTKTRKEMESKVDDGEILKEILRTLGFREVLTVKKERELYSFTYQDKKIEVLIDYLPVLEQHFIEVELLVEEESHIPQVRELLFSFLNNFNIDKQNSIRKSYLELILDKLQSKE